MSALSAGASSRECWSTFPKSNRVGIGDPGDRLVRHDHRGRQEPAFGADLDPARAGGLLVVSGVGKTFGSVCAAASSAGFSATSLSVPVVGSATYHCRFQKRSFAAFRIR